MSKAADPSSNVAAAHRRRVDQVGDHLDGDARRAAAEAVGPEHPVDPLVGRQPHRRALDHALAALGQEHDARRDLDDAADRHLAHRHAVAQRRGGDRDAARLEARHRRARAVDRVDDQHGLGARRARPARGPRSRRRRPARARRRNEPSSSSASASISKVTSPPSASASPCARARVRAELRHHALAQRERQLADELPHPARRRACDGRGPSLTVTVRRSPPRTTLQVDLLARALLADQVGQVASCGQLACRRRATITSPPRGMSALALELDLALARRQAGLVGRRRPSRPVATSAPRSTGRPSRRGELRVERRRAHAEEAVVDLAGLAQLRRASA